MRVLFICLFFLSTGLINAQSGMLEGIIIDSETGEAIPYATVSMKINETLKGTVSNEDGYFALEKMPIGDYEVSVNYLGYKEQTYQKVKIEKESSRNLLIELETDLVVLEEIIIEAFSEEIRRCDWPICCSPVCVGHDINNTKVLTTGKEEAAKQNSVEENIVNLKVYPNPTQGLLNLEIKESLEEVFLSNAQGQRLIELGNLESGNQSIDLSPYPVGMYLVNYVYQNKVFSEKLILVH